MLDIGIAAPVAVVRAQSRGRIASGSACPRAGIRATAADPADWRRLRYRRRSWRNVDRRPCHRVGLLNDHVGLGNIAIRGKDQPVGRGQDGQDQDRVTARLKSARETNDCDRRFLTSASSLEAPLRLSCAAVFI